MDNATNCVDRASVHRFYNSLCLYLHRDDKGRGESFYVTPSHALQLAAQLLMGALDCHYREDFTKSEFGTHDSTKLGKAFHIALGELLWAVDTMDCDGPETPDKVRLTLTLPQARAMDTIVENSRFPDTLEALFGCKRDKAVALRAISKWDAVADPAYVKEEIEGGGS